LNHTRLPKEVLLSDSARGDIQGKKSDRVECPSLHPSGTAFPLSSMKRYIYFEHELPVWPIYINRISGAYRYIT